MLETTFVGFPKIPRLNRDIVITEKIDGTNAAIGIERSFDGGDDTKPLWNVYAQSRTRIIRPEADNFGFAAWVEQHKATLIEALGEGLHFGEWWGVGIQRGYGLSERRFSLFNTHRWAAGSPDPRNGAEALAIARSKGCAIYCIPILYKGGWLGADQGFQPAVVLSNLRGHGSHAAPGFMQPEGIVVYHNAGGYLFKATCEKDEAAKGTQKEARHG